MLKVELQHPLQGRNLVVGVLRSSATAWPGREQRL